MDNRNAGISVRQSDFFLRENTKSSSKAVVNNGSGA